jgi:hypothetical protein
MKKQNCFAALALISWLALLQQPARAEEAEHAARRFMDAGHRATKLALATQSTELKKQYTREALADFLAACEEMERTPWNTDQAADEFCAHVQAEIDEEPDETQSDIETRALHLRESTLEP